MLAGLSLPTLSHLFLFKLDPHLLVVRFQHFRPLIGKLLLLLQLCLQPLLSQHEFMELCPLLLQLRLRLLRLLQQL